jgi:hypothetical protein
MSKPRATGQAAVDEKRSIDDNPPVVAGGFHLG